MNKNLFIFLILKSSLIFSKNNFSGDSIQEAIRKSNAQELENLLKSHNLTDADKKSYLELAQEITKYRREKSILDKVDNSNKFWIQRFIGRSMVSLGSLGMGFSLGGALNSHDRIERSAFQASFISSGLITTFGAIILWVLPSKAQILRDKYNRALEIKQRLQKSVNVDQVNS